MEAKDVKEVIIWKKDSEPQRITDKAEIQKVIDKMPKKTEFEKRFETWKRKRQK